MDEAPPAGAADPLEALLARALDRLAEGGAAALEELLAAHPAERPELLLEIERLRHLGLLLEGDPRAAPCERVGDFRLLRRIGGGGMGVVYEALQLSLGRTVAVKLIRPELVFFGKSRERFRREVAAAAGLCHPGIAQVLAGGEEGGLPWYAMELVDGEPLDGLLRSFEGRDPAALRGDDLRRAIEARLGPSEVAAAVGGAAFEGSWTELALRIARQVAEALEHAHGRGVVHRDVKPSNVLVTRSGRAILVDFGLALRGEAERLTRSGAQPGSLPYMSPEQLAGGPVDARTDVYSLGVTLRELLTLAPAFSGTEEHVRASIAAGSLAAWPRSIPADARTVVDCAMERDPSRRYATAAELARDLANLIEHRPIDARAPGFFLRLVRAAQRHPRAAAAGLTAVLIGLAASLLVLGRERGHSRELRAERDRVRALADDLREERDAARELSGEVQAIAAGLVREVHTAIADLPGATAAREGLIARATELLESLRGRGLDDAELGADLAFAHLKLGEVLCATLTPGGSAPQAVDHFRAARALLEDLAETAMAPREHWVVSAILGEARAIEWSEPARALELVREAVPRAEALAAEHPEDDDLGALCMHARLMLAHSLGAGEADRRAALLERIVEDGERILARSGPSAPGIQTLAQALRDQASAAADASRTEEAFERYGAMERLARAMVEARLDSKTSRQMLVQALIGRGEQLYRMARLDEAAEDLTRASAELDGILDPLDLPQMLDRLRVALRLGEIQRERGELEAAAAALRAGVKACEAASPAGATPLSAALVRLSAALGGAELDLGRLDAAEAVLREAGARLETLEPREREGLLFLDAAFVLRGVEMRLHDLRGDQDACFAAAEGCVDLLRRLSQARPADRSVKANLALQESLLAELAAARGDARDWMAVHDRSVEFLRGLHGEDPGRALLSEALALCLLRRAAAREAAGNASGAEADCAEALALAEDLVERRASSRAAGLAEDAREGLAAARAARSGSSP